MRSESAIHPTHATPCRWISLRLGLAFGVLTFSGCAQPPSVQRPDSSSASALSYADSTSTWRVDVRDNSGRLLTTLWLDWPDALGEDGEAFVRYGQVLPDGTFGVAVPALMTQEGEALELQLRPGDEHGPRLRGAAHGDRWAGTYRAGDMRPSRSSGTFIAEPFRQP